MNSETVFAPLPVRRRGTLEILDTALKLYRRYFGVLTGWTLLVSVTWLLSFVVPFAYLIAFPLTYGAVTCCIAGAVRGQQVSFSQVWEFTKPRYGAMIGLFLLSLLIMAGVALALMIASGILIFAAIYLFSYAPTWLQVTMGIIGYIAFLLFTTIVSTAMVVWQNIVLCIVCLEDDKRNTTSLGRAWQLLQGQWKGVFGMATLLAIASIVVFGMIAALVAFFGQSIDIFSPNASTSAILALGASISFIFGLTMLFWIPAQAMISAVLYLDLRVRKEALDIEWTAYSSDAPTPAEQHVPNPHHSPAPTPMQTMGGVPGVTAPGGAVAPSSFGVESSPTPNQQPPAVPSGAPQTAGFGVIPPEPTIASAPSTGVEPSVAPPVVSHPTVAPPAVAPPMVPPQSTSNAAQTVPPVVSQPQPTPPLTPPAHHHSTAPEPTPGVTSSFAPPPSFGASPAPPSSGPSPSVPHHSPTPTPTPTPEPSPFGSTSPNESATSSFAPSSGGSSFGTSFDGSSFGASSFGNSTPADVAPATDGAHPSASDSAPSFDSSSSPSFDSSPSVDSSSSSSNPSS